MPDNNEVAFKLETGPTKAVEFTIQIKRPDSYAYSNVAGIALTPWDLRIHFADVNPDSPEPQEFKAHTGIVMPPEHAAGLAFLIFDQLKLYENQFGPIRQDRWRAMIEKTKTKAAVSEAPAKPEK